MIKGVPPDINTGKIRRTTKNIIRLIIPTMASNIQRFIVVVRYEFKCIKSPPLMQANN